MGSGAYFMVCDNGLINVLKMMVDHCEETKSLSMLRFYLEYSLIIGFGQFVISV
jgi:hypothetical protein